MNQDPMDREASIKDIVNLCQRYNTDFQIRFVENGMIVTFGEHFAWAVDLRRSQTFTNRELLEAAQHLAAKLPFVLKSPL